MLITLKESNRIKCKWLDFIYNICNSTGMNFLLNTDNISLSTQFIKYKIKNVLQDHFIQSWFSDIEKSSRHEFYGIFKTEFKLESYLIKLPRFHNSWICKFRTANIKIPVETGRWKNIPKENRICTFCNDGIGDEFHYLFVCKNYDINALRNKYVPTYYSSNPTKIKLKGLLSFCHVELLSNISRFIRELSKLL